MSKLKRSKSLSLISPPGIDSRLTTSLQSIWSLIETAPEEERENLIIEINSSISRLRSRLQKRLSKALLNDHQLGLLFANEEKGTLKKNVSDWKTIGAIRFPEAKKRVYARDLAEHALAHLPQAIHFSDYAKFRDYLIANL